MPRMRQLAAEAAIVSNVKWPGFVKRKFRTLDDLPRYKGTEIHYFFYLLPAFRPCVAGPAFHVLLALSTAFSILEADAITEESCGRAKKLLIAVHGAICAVFGRNVMTMNTHLLLHLADQCKALGPLWAVSSNVFESHLFHLGRLKRGVRGFLRSIGDQFSLRKQIWLSGARSKKKVRNFWFFEIILLSYLINCWILLFRRSWFWLMVPRFLESQRHRKLHQRSL